jgi:hypothetical protein
MSDRHPLMSTDITPAEGVMADQGFATPLPLLVEGQRLDQPTFHARYEAMPPGTRAELIDGVVYMPSPVGPDHGRAHHATSAWLNYYQEFTPGVDGLDNTSTALGTRSEPQPDLMLRVLLEYGGRTRDVARIIDGVPELLAEVSDTTRHKDLGPKLKEYERAGVQEYVVRALEPDAVYWFVLREGRLVEQPPGPDGIYRSEVFPGLWLDPDALIRGDRPRLRAVVKLGCATPEHAAFVARLAAVREQAQGQAPA